MTQKIIFSDITTKAFRVIERRETMLDVDLMIVLGFSPPAWKVWKPQLIQKLTNMMLPKTENNEDGYIVIKITYNKKEKTWKATEILE